MGNNNTFSHPDFAVVPNGFSTQNTTMRKEALAAFLAMAKAAAKDGVSLTIVSGTRNRARQIEIWTEKWNRGTGTDVEKAQQILSYSSMPGTSRHHWGTDIDINSVDPEHFTNATGDKTYRWLYANAKRFGFYQPYKNADESCDCGYREEKWHWSYFPISNQMLRAYKRMITYNDISGFPGAETAKELHVLEHFVNGLPEINPLVEAQKHLQDSLQ